MSAGARLKAIEYVLGLRSAEEAQEIAAARQTDPALDIEIRELEALLHVLDRPGAFGSEPDPLFARVLAEVVAGTHGGAWSELRPQLAVRPLWNDRTFLIRCAEGTPFPAHYHDREERMILLQGDMRIGAARLSAGAIEVSAAGSRHEDGCALSPSLCLVQYSA